MAMPAVERLVNLTVALLEARRPMTFAELRRRTGYYPQSDPATARRMFERDKDTLRSYGIPIDMRQDAFMEEPGYIIDRRAYELRDVALDAEEVAALALAVDLVGASGAALPLAKVSALAPDPVPLTAPPTRLHLEVAPIEPFAAAVVERRRVRFGYRTADGREGDRTVEPYGVVRRRRAWYVVGRDVARDALRGFRVDRMVGAPEVLEPPAAFEVPIDVDPGSVVAGPETEPVDVVLAVGASATWTVAARGGVDVGSHEDGRRRMRLAGIDPLRDRAWLLAIAPEVELLEPAGLAVQISTALHAVLAAHEGDAERPQVIPG